jgi:hypothetical protein
VSCWSRWFQRDRPRVQLPAQAETSSTARATALAWREVDLFRKLEALLRQSPGPGAGESSGGTAGPEDLDGGCSVVRRPYPRRPGGGGLLARPGDTCWWDWGATSAPPPLYWPWLALFVCAGWSASVNVAGASLGLVVLAMVLSPTRLDAYVHWIQWPLFRRIINDHSPAFLPSELQSLTLKTSFWADRRPGTKLLSTCYFLSQAVTLRSGAVARRLSELPIRAGMGGRNLTTAFISLRYG